MPKNYRPITQSRSPKQMDSIPESSKEPSTPQGLSPWNTSMPLESLIVRYPFLWPLRYQISRERLEAMWGGRSKVTPQAGSTASRGMSPTTAVLPEISTTLLTYEAFMAARQNTPLAGSDGFQ